MAENTPGAGVVLELNADTILREQILARDKANFDYFNDIATAKLEGRVEGKAEGLAEGLEIGKAEGLTEGLAKGKAEGLTEGLAKGKLNILKELVKDGILSLADAAAKADLTPAEFQAKTRLNE